MTLYKYIEAIYRLIRHIIQFMWVEYYITNVRHALTKSPNLEVLMHAHGMYTTNMSINSH